MKITTLVFVGLALSLHLSAQDAINCSACGAGGTNLGEYTTGGSTGPLNLILNNTSAGPTPNTVTAPNGNTVDFNAIGGENNSIQDRPNEQSLSNLVYGESNLMEGSRASFILGAGNTVSSGLGSVALGGDNRLTADLTFGFGQYTNVTNNKAIAIGFGSSGNNLNDAGSESITLGVDGQNVFNLKLNSNNNPVTGIGTGTSTPNAKLQIVGNGTGTNAALNVQNSNNDNRLKVRNDGWTGFSADPGAPYFFTKTNLSPFPAGNDGEANIVQNYNSFPFFAGSSGNSSSSAKWLALGERPPASNLDAYGLANVWDNFAGNFFLLENPNTSSPTIKDLTISFQDVGQNAGLTDPANARNRMRFIFRNSRDIDASQPSVFELMSLEPTGEVAVGDYSGSVTPDAKRFEVKANSNTDCANADCRSDDGNNTYDPETIMEVLRDGSATNRGNEILTVNDGGHVGINRPQPSAELDINGTGLINGNLITSDKRYKKDLELIQNPLKKLKKIRGLTYSYKNKEYPNQNFGKGRWSGVIAQDVKKVLPEAVRKYHGHYAVNYDGIIPLLIETNKKQQETMKKQEEKIEKLQKKAQKVDELQKQVEKLQEQVNGLVKDEQQPANSFKNGENEDLNKRIVAIGNEGGEQQAMLLQNRPNPYSNETIIPYFLPQDFENANLVITNTNGQLIKRIKLNKPGKGELTLRTGNLNAGQYIYSLIVDGRKIQARKMVVKK